MINYFQSNNNHWVSIKLRNLYLFISMCFNILYKIFIQVGDFRFNVYFELRYILENPKNHPRVLVGIFLWAHRPADQPGPGCSFLI